MIKYNILHLFFYLNFIKKYCNQSLPQRAGYHLLPLYQNTRCLLTLHILILIRRDSSKYKVGLEWPNQAYRCHVSRVEMDCDTFYTWFVKWSLWLEHLQPDLLNPSYISRRVTRSRFFNPDEPLKWPSNARADRHRLYPVQIWGEYRDVRTHPPHRTWQPDPTPNCTKSTPKTNQIHLLSPLFFLLRVVRLALGRRARSAAAPRFSGASSGKALPSSPRGTSSPARMPPWYVRQLSDSAYELSADASQSSRSAGAHAATQWSYGAHVDPQWQPRRQCLSLALQINFM